MHWLEYAISYSHQLGVVLGKDIKYYPWEDRQTGGEELYIPEPPVIYFRGSCKLDNTQGSTTAYMVYGHVSLEGGILKTHILYFSKDGGHQYHTEDYLKIFESSKEAVIKSFESYFNQDGGVN